MRDNRNQFGLELSLAACKMTTQFLPIAPSLGLAVVNSESPDLPRNQPNVDQWVAEAKNGEISWSELAERILRHEQASGGADCPDTDRARRCGFGEVIFGSGKTIASVIQIARDLLDSGQREVLVTRCVSEMAEAVIPEFQHSRYSEVGRTLRISDAQIADASIGEVPSPAPSDSSRSQTDDSGCAPFVAVVSAGSTDAPVAQEALETLLWMGIPAKLICDVGVAGPYRLLPHLDVLRQAVCVVVVAGMEGALASVMGGFVSAPVIAVPTSVGYGANLEGITTLLSMMSSCAAGVTVVNIDAGFKGGYIAGLIANQVKSVG